MKAYYLLLLFVLTTLLSCEMENNDLNDDLTDGFCIIFGNEHVLNHAEIDFYDFSTHLIYLKNSSSFIKDYETGGGFKVYADRKEIYTGLIHPGYSSYLPSSPVIHSNPFYYQDHIIQIDFIQIFDSEGKIKPDIRADEKIAQALKKYNQYRVGLSVSINSLQYSSENNEVTIQLQLQNTDSFNYYYLDPEKMGMDLFHYFTNGLTVMDLINKKSYSHGIVPTHPEPWDAWKNEWLSMIESNENKLITLVYKNFDIIPSGEFKACFTFPGLTHQVAREDIQQGNGRIWLGKLLAIEELNIE
jgi:hypothetical protein